MSSEPAADSGAKAAGAPVSGPRAAIIRAGHLFFRWRNGLFPLLFLAIALVTRPRPAFGSEARDVWTDVAGFAIALAGQTLRVLVIGLAYIRRGGRNKAIYADALVQDGFFAHSRNPLYVGNMLVFLGLFVILDSVGGYLIGIPFFLFAYYAIVLAEEDFLRREFGAEYDAYCRRVNRFVPSLRGLGRTIRGMEFDWRRVVRKEYGSTFTWLTTALALLLWERLAWHGAPGVSPILGPVLTAWALVILGWALARFLKKTGRLRST